MSSCKELPGRCRHTWLIVFVFTYVCYVANCTISPELGATEAGTGATGDFRRRTSIIDKDNDVVGNKLNSSDSGNATTSTFSQDPNPILQGIGLGTLHNSDSLRTNGTGSESKSLLTNARRQIENSSGNPISNLHEKVNGQGKTGEGGGKLNVTDASSSSSTEFENVNSSKNSSFVIRQSAKKRKKEVFENVVNNVQVPRPSKHRAHSSVLNNKSAAQKNSLAGSAETNFKQGLLCGMPGDKGLRSQILDQTSTRSLDAKDTDKWIRTLVNISKCTAKCLLSALSTCQEACKFPPQKLRGRKNKEVGKNESNKANATGDELRALRITRSDTGAFHLHWPSATTAEVASSTMPVVYNVLIRTTTSTHDPAAWRAASSSTWKLIDQTVAEQTQISLETHVCQQIKPMKTLRKTISWGKTEPPLLRKYLMINPLQSVRRRLMVVAVSWRGVEKVSSGLLVFPGPCCQLMKKNEDALRPRSYIYDKQLGRGGLEGQASSQKALNEVSSPGTAGDLRELQPDKPVSWGLRMVSMSLQNHLVVTEISWKVPEEADAIAAGVLMTHTNAALDERKSDGSSSPNSSKRGYQYLLTWEIFGGGLRGNLVTDMTSGTISLWPDTAYFIQVGLINQSNVATLQSTSEQPSNVNSMGNQIIAQSELVGTEHQNNMSNLLGVESIIFPLAEGQVRVTLSSERLLVNTSEISIPVTSPWKSDSIKSNNPSLQQEHETRTKWNVRPIVISGPAVSKNGNENDHPTKKRKRPSVGVSWAGSGRRIRPHLKYMMSDSSSSGISGISSSWRKPSARFSHNGYEDKRANIHDNKHKRNSKRAHERGKSDHESRPVTPKNVFRADVYEGLFSLNMGLGGFENEDQAHNGLVVNEKFAYGSSGTHNNNSTKLRPHDERAASVIYSIFVLVVVACVIFLFLVAFIGFFVVTSSISTTAHYFLPKRLRIWVIGETSDRELLAPGSDTEGQHDPGDDDEMDDGDFDNCDDLEEESSADCRASTAPPTDRDSSRRRIARAQGILGNFLQSIWKANEQRT